MFIYYFVFLFLFRLRLLYHWTMQFISSKLSIFIIFFLFFATYSPRFKFISFNFILFYFIFSNFSLFFVLFLFVFLKVLLEDSSHPTYWSHFLRTSSYTQEMKKWQNGRTSSIFTVFLRNVFFFFFPPFFLFSAFFSVFLLAFFISFIMLSLLCLFL